MHDRNLGPARLADGPGRNSRLPGQFPQPVEVLPPASHEYPGLGLAEKQCVRPDGVFEGDGTAKFYPAVEGAFRQSHRQATLGKVVG